MDYLVTECWVITVGRWWRWCSRCLRAKLNAHLISQGSQTRVCFQLLQATRLPLKRHIWRRWWCFFGLQSDADDGVQVDLLDFDMDGIGMGGFESSTKWVSSESMFPTLHVGEGAVYTSSSPIPTSLHIISCQHTAASDDIHINNCNFISVKIYKISLKMNQIEVRPVHTSLQESFPLNWMFLESGLNVCLYNVCL